MINRIRQYIKDEEFRLTIFSNRLHVVNYVEMLSLSSDRISFLTDKFRIVIKGKDLTVNKLLDKEVLILGVILNVEVNYE